MIAFSLLCVVALAPKASSAKLSVPPAPPGLTAQGPIVQATSVRGDIVLNGVWRFTPAVSGENEPEFGDGRIWVPGDWANDSGEVPGVVQRGTGPAWAQDLKQVGKAWYERTIQVPASWKGRAVRLDLRRVSTDAEVWLDGRSAGRVAWPTGTVDLTPFVKPGEDQRLRLLVVATPEAGQVPVLMGVGQVSLTEANLAWRGVMDDVILQSRPLGPTLDDLFVQTSTRKNSVTVDVEVAGMPEATPVDFRAEMLNEKGEVEKTFTARETVTAGPKSKVRLTWPWADARRWDADQPNLYTLRLTATGGAMNDVALQRFGFREFWVEGRKFFLNGTEFRFRPTLLYDGGVRARSENDIRAFRARGYNIQEIWPNDDENRGYAQWWAHHVEVADELGWPLMGPSTHMDSVVSWWRAERWSDPAARAAWLAAFERSIKRLRNSPSILLWANSGNNFGHRDDQSPRRIGQARSKPIWASEEDRWVRHHENGDLVFAAMRQFDPTRPFMAHQGGPISDVYTANTYLNFLPLQDREEWLSEWARTGDMPYVAVEFGTPLNMSVMRGRDGFPGALVSEPFATEYSAMHFGDQAYRTEPADYRAAIVENHVKGQDYKWWFEPRLDFSAPFQAIQELYVRNTWRAWRTWGLSGGMIPWAQAHGWQPNGAGEALPVPAFRPGDRGLTSGPIEARRRSDLMTAHLAGRTLMSVNQATLAYVGSRKARWTEKSHQFWTGRTVEKTVILINDERSAQPFVARWSTPTAKGEFRGTLQPAETRIEPIRFPAGTQPGRGAVTLDATIGGVRHQDRFEYRVFGAPAPGQGAVTVWDPAGETARMLRSAGYTVRPLSSSVAPTDVLVIGRKAMTSGRRIPLDLEKWVRGGGRLLVMGQTTDWWTATQRFRVSPLASRRVFPLPHPSPLMVGLDAKALSDWTGEATLRSGYPPDSTLLRKVPDSSPMYGWPWGMQGVVATAQVEVPHRSGWTPLLVGEFDLAYSPLMELNVGRGRVVVCTLDLEDQARVDPAAAVLVRRVVTEARRTAEPRVAEIAFLGRDARLLDEVGVRYRRVTGLAPSLTSVVVGADASLTEAAARQYLSAGGRLIFLPRKRGFGPMNAVQDDRFSGVATVPDWPEVRGLGTSDVRRRTVSTLYRVTGVEAGAGGQLGRWRVGKGVALFVQMDPAELRVEERTYLRLTRWRQMRTLAQVLTNAGATFAMDRAFFAPPSASAGTLRLDGTWRAKETDSAPVLPDTPGNDPGLSAAARAVMGPDVNDADWATVRLPGMWSPLNGRVAEAVFRQTLDVPQGWAGQDLLLRLGGVDDYDVTFWNGEQVGATDRRTPNWWSARREYKIPGRLVRAGRNVLAVRALNVQGDGGIGGPVTVMGLDLVGFREPAGYYHPDYRSDWNLGDDPYRYYRW